MASTNPNASNSNYADKLAAKQDQQQTLEEYLALPGVQLSLEQQALNTKQKNAAQRAYNQNAANQAANQKAGLQLDAAQLQFSQQQGVTNLVQELMRQRLQELLANQNGQRSIMDQSGRLLDTRFNIERTGLLDQLRLMQQQQDLNRIADTSQSRARRLLGG